MLGNLLKPGGSYKDRITEAIIETPDKVRHKFMYGDLEKNIEKKTSKYRFGDTEGTYVQDFGVGEISLPIVLYFAGKNYDRDAKTFENSASKKGICILEHPIYGVKNVIIEKIQRQDNLKTSSGQAIFTLTITETIDFKIPYVEEDLGFGLTKALESLSDSIKEAFNNSFLGKTAQSLANAATRIEGYVNDVVSAVEFIASTVDSISSAIYSIQRYINSNMSALLESPFTLAGSIDALIKSPTSAIASIQNKFDMYKTMYEGGKTFEGGIDSSKNSNDKKNMCAGKMLGASSIMGAMCECVLYADNDGLGFKTRSDASQFALDLMNQYYDIQNFLDSMQKNTQNDNLENTFVVDSQLAYNLKYVVAITVKNLVNLAFTLKQERIIFTDREYNILELCHKLYGTSKDETLQYFIDSNNLIGHEITMIPENREIKYYV